jgi:hypothetical protein
MGKEIWKALLTKVLCTFTSHGNFHFVFFAIENCNIGGVLFDDEAADSIGVVDVVLQQCVKKSGDVKWLFC